MFPGVDAGVTCVHTGAEGGEKGEILRSCVRPHWSRGWREGGNIGELCASTLEQRVERRMKYCGEEGGEKGELCAKYRAQCIYNLIRCTPVFIELI